MSSPPAHPGHPPDDSKTANPLLALSGTILESRYELGRVLGAGGMGAVFEAKHLRLDRTVAIKVLRPVFVGHDEYIKRFLREAKVASKIRHRNVVEIHDYGEATGGLVYSVMELLRGQDLHQFLEAQPGHRLPWPQVCALLLQAANGLKAAHAAGIVHRDIKPANCFLTTDDDGQPLVKLVDFGIAKVDDADQSQQLTGTAEVLGTPAYIAPEMMLTKSPASPRSDIYSLGVLAYRMLSGRVPFSGETAFHVLHRACFEPVPPLCAHVPELPPAVEAFVLRMLAKTADERPPDMQAVRDALLALGRDTLGAQAVQIPVSSALALGTIERSGSSGPSEGPTLPRAAALPPVAPAPQAAPMITEVMLAPLSPSPGPPAPRPAGATPRVLVAPVGAPQQPIYDPSSAPAPQASSPTLPSVRESTLPLHDTGSTRMRRADRRGRVIWLGAGGLAVGAFAVVAIALQSTTDTPSGPAPMSGVGAAAVEPKPKPAATAAVEPEPAQEPTPEVVPSPALEPDPDPEIVIDPSPPSEPEPTPPPEPTPRPAKTSKPKTTAPKTTAPKPAPSAPPSDVTLTKQLKDTIKAKCSDAMAGNTITVSFMVRTDGKIMGLSATPKGPAAQCAMDRVKGTVFRPRFKSEPKKFTVT